VRSLAGRVRARRPSGGGLIPRVDPPAGRVLFIFLDGVGVGAADPSINPIAAAKLPHLEGIFGSTRLLSTAAPTVGDLAGYTGIDACLGVQGLPQSGTGQTALLTGANAAQLVGRHFGPWVPTAIRDLLATRNLFGLARDAGIRVRFANAYPALGREREEGVRRPGAFPLAARAADLLEFDEESLRGGRALASSITTDRWRQYVDPRAPLVRPAEAGERLGRMAGENELTVFAHYDTDYIGHRGTFEEAVASIELVDAFLGGVLAARSPDTLVLITSDHGNLEDARVGHTRNEVPLLAIGPSHGQAIANVRALTDVAPFILGLLQTARGPEELKSSERRGLT
jgi:2,3-bisphosphoglycerate-independent phosphoglycerate mutase